MPQLISTPTDTSRKTMEIAERTTVISANDARQGPAGHELLYVLGFGTGGAIVGVSAVLLYFELLRAWT